MIGRRYFLPAVLLLTFLLSLLFYRTVQSYEGTTGFFYEKEELSREAVSDYWKDAPPEAKREIKSSVLLGKEKEVNAENISTDVKKKISLITAAGDMDLATPGALLMGGFAGDKDEKGAVISKKAAEELFGTRQVVGKEIKLEEKMYIIRGVLDIEEAMCLIQGEKNALYDTILVKAPGIPVSAITRLMAACVPESYTRISEGGLYAGTARLVVFLPVWILMIMVLVRGRKKAKSYLNRMEDCGRRKEYLNSLLGVLFPITVFAVFCLLLLASVCFSDDYVPSAWSDFEFWGNLFTQKWEQTSALLREDLLFADGRMLWHTAACMLSSMVCTIGLLFSRRTVIKRNAADGTCGDVLLVECRDDG